VSVPAHWVGCELHTIPGVPHAPWGWTTVGPGHTAVGGVGIEASFVDGGPGNVVEASFPGGVGVLIAPSDPASAVEPVVAGSVTPSSVVSPPHCVSGRATARREKVRGMRASAPWRKAMARA
jgi:hypothetical protein